jgi:hypothetical protein
VLEVFGERGQLRYERAGEAGAPAFLEDRLLELFDEAVRGWPASARGRFPAKRKRSVLSTARSTRSATGAWTSEAAHLPKLSQRHRRPARTPLEPGSGDATLRRRKQPRRLLPDVPARELATRSALLGVRSRAFWTESSIIGSIPNARWQFCKRIRTQKHLLAGSLQSPLTDSNRRPPPYHGTSQATGGSPRQRFSPI